MFGGRRRRRAEIQQVGHGYRTLVGEGPPTVQDLLVTGVLVGGESFFLIHVCLGMFVCGLLVCNPACDAMFEIPPFFNLGTAVAFAAAVPVLRLTYTLVVRGRRVREDGPAAMRKDSSVQAGSGAFDIWGPL